MLCEIEFKREMYQKVESVLGQVNPDTLREDYIAIIRAENMAKIKKPNIETLAKKVLRTCPNSFVLGDCFKVAKVRC
jgi:hypothetical protein